MRYRPTLPVPALLLAPGLLLALAGLALGGCGSSSGPAASAAPPPGWIAHPPLHVISVAPAQVSGYTPTQIRHAYSFDKVAATGSGQVIAIVDAYGSPTIQSDLNTFCSHFGLPATTVRIAYPQGGGAPPTNSGWALETSLDVEWAHVVAPGATLLLVVVSDPSFDSLLAGVDYAASRAAQVSMSWGGSEFSGETSYDYHFNVSGVSFTCASGDSGSGAQWPAVSPLVTCVGGTTLSLTSAGDVISETAWSDSNGGPSAYENESAYQRAWQNSGNREMPDVAYDGDPNTGVPVYDSTPDNRQSGWFQIGGTSLGAPQWAALLALVNASRSPHLSGANAAVYSLAASHSLGYYLRDITSGSNDSYSAGRGYDLVTGLGTPHTAVLVRALAAR